MHELMRSRAAGGCSGKCIYQEFRLERSETGRAEKPVTLFHRLWPAGSRRRHGRHGATCPLGRVVEIAKAAVLLASEDSSFVAGAGCFRNVCAKRMLGCQQHAYGIPLTEYCRRAAGTSHAQPGGKGGRSGLARRGTHRRLILTNFSGSGCVSLPRLETAVFSEGTPKRREPAPPFVGSDPACETALPWPATSRAQRS
jgi:hypothetical protein